MRCLLFIFNYQYILKYSYIIKNRYLIYVESCLHGMYFLTPHYHQFWMVFNISHLPDGLYAALNQNKDNFPSCCKNATGRLRLLQIPFSLLLCVLILQEMEVKTPPPFEIFFKNPTFFLKKKRNRAVFFQEARNDAYQVFPIKSKHTFKRLEVQ